MHNCLSILHQTKEKFTWIIKPKILISCEIANDNKLPNPNKFLKCQGNEMASHSITHDNDEDYWTLGSKETWAKVKYFLEYKVRFLFEAKNL